MKAIIIGAQSILSGDYDVVVVGGMENMSMVPHYLDKSRSGQKLGDMILIDGLVKDGLTDVYNKTHMGLCAETCAEEMNFSREEQDDFAIESYKKSANSWANNLFSNEVISVTIPQRKGDDLIISEDEEYKKVLLEKIPNLRPVFKKGSYFLETTNKCNLACPHCYQEPDNKSIDPAILSILAKIKSWPDDGYPVALVGAEPTTRKDLPELK